MKKLSLFTILFTILNFTATGQTLSREFGVISITEYDMEEYTPDKDAEAVVLFDYGQSSFIRNENNFDVVFERTTRIKILTDAGIDYAQIEIPIYQEGNIYEKLYDVEAYTYNFENGRTIKTPLDLSNIYEEVYNEYWVAKKFAMPNVKKGSVIEYRYKIKSPYKFNFRDWEFQWKIPVVYSEYTCKMIPFYEYVWLFQGAEKFDVYDSYPDPGLKRRFGTLEYSDMVYKFGMNNLPAFRDESYITSINDYITKLDFQLAGMTYTNGTKVKIITTWEDLIKDLIKEPDFGKYAQKSENMAKKLIDTETLSTQDEKTRFNAVIDYVKSNYTWDGRNSFFAYKSANDLVKDKSGNSADINLFTIGLLNSVGIETYPVILSTRDHGKIKHDYPFRRSFNYVAILSKIDGKLVLSDATDPYCTNLQTPVRCINDKGLIVKKDNTDWLNLESSNTSSLATNILLTLTEGNTVDARINKRATNFDALYFRNNYPNDTKKIKEKLTSDGYEIIDSTISIQNFQDKLKPYVLSYDLQTNTESVNNKFYITPFLNEVISDSPLKQKKRTYPVDLTYTKMRTFNSTISILDGYEVDYLPEQLTIKNSLFELNYIITNNNDNQLQVSFSYMFKKPLYSPEEYARIKYYFNEIVKKGNEKIVLSKKI